MGEYFTKKVQNVSNFLKAFNSDIVFSSNKIERNIYVTACFSHAFEMTWKALKKLLQLNGIKEADTGSPKAIIKLSFSESYINNEDLWLDILDARNTIEHTYIEDMPDDFVNKVATIYKYELQRTYEILRLYDDNGESPVRDIITKYNLPLTVIEDAKLYFHVNELTADQLNLYIKFKEL